MGTPGIGDLIWHKDTEEKSRRLKLARSAWGALDPGWKSLDSSIEQNAYKIERFAKKSWVFARMPLQNKERGTIAQEKLLHFLINFSETSHAICCLLVPFSAELTLPASDKRCLGSDELIECNSILLI